MNTYEWKAGRLLHYFNGELRASVASEHVHDYLVATDANPDDIPEEPSHDQA